MLCNLHTTIKTACYYVNFTHVSVRMGREYTAKSPYAECYRIDTFVKSYNIHGAIREAYASCIILAGLHAHCYAIRVHDQLSSIAGFE
jgi:hypothetical protein